jgi:hypothetical protein
MRNRLFVCIATLLFVSCWNKKTQQQTEEVENTQEVEAIQFGQSKSNIDKKLSEGDYPHYSIDVKADYIKGNNRIAQIINKQLAAFLFENSITPFEDAKKHFTDSLAKDFESTLLDFYDKDDDFQDMYDYNYEQEAKLTTDAPAGVIAFKNVETSYTGGAHGSYLENYINFREETGEAITCNALFGSKEKSVLKLIRNQILKDNNCRTAEQLEEKTDIFSLGDVYISDYNFLLQKDGIIFCYNPYEIAPWSVGVIHVKLTYEQLKDLITTDYTFIIQ